MVSIRKVIGNGLALVGLCGVLATFLVHVEYYRVMPRHPQQEAGRVLRYRAMRTTVYVSQRELRLAQACTLMAPIGFALAGLGVYLLIDRRRAPPKDR
jgi:hypothetical protein